MHMFKSAFGRISQDRLLAIGLSIVVFYIVIGALAPVLAPPAPDSDPFIMPRDLEMFEMSALPTPPTLKHIFGTTGQQYDVFYGCIWGILSALRIGLLATLGAMSIGIGIGTITGYFGGFFDEAIGWFVNVFLAASLILAMALVMALPRSIGPLSLTRVDRLTIVLVLFGWPICANIIRNEISKIRNRSNFREPQARSMSKEQVWETYPTLIFHAACIQIGSMVLFAAALSFLGFGPSPDYADWGNLIVQVRYYVAQTPLLLSNWNTYVFPGVFLFTFVLGWMSLGEGVRGVIEKRQTRILKCKSIDSENQGE